MEKWESWIQIPIPDADLWKKFAYYYTTIIIIKITIAYQKQTLATKTDNNKYLQRNRLNL